MPGFPFQPQLQSYLVHLDHRTQTEAEKNAIEYCKETVEGCMLEVRLCIGGGEVSLMPMAVAASVIWPGPSHK